MNHGHLALLLLLVHGCDDTRDTRDAAIPDAAVDPVTDASVTSGRDATVRFDAAPADASGGASLECSDIGVEDQCHCYRGEPGSAPVSSCDEGHFAPRPALCCANDAFPEVGTCTCMLWGCNSLISDEGGCGCGRGAGFPDTYQTSCSKGSPDHICCAGIGGLCHCYGIGAEEGCPADRVEVPRCDITTVICSVPSFPIDDRVASCSGA